MSAVVEKLKEARALISEPKHWTQGKFARSEGGRTAQILGPEAFCFCALGAVLRVCGQDNPNDVELALEASLPSEFRSVPIFNDNSNHSDVLALFDAAIARLSA